MLKRLYFTSCFLLFFYAALAQEAQAIENNNNYKFQSEKAAEQQTQTRPKTKIIYKPSWSFGGNLGFSFWNGGTDILVAPKAYYNISPKFLTGFGLTYIYSDYDDQYFGYHSNSFGGSVMAAVRPVPMFQLSVEYEGLNTSRGGYLAADYWNNALYLGASFVSGKVSFGFRYDVLYNVDQSVYGSAWNPVIGFYF